MLMASDFSERLPSWDWDDLTLRINSKTARDVEQALNSAKLTR
jgi:2-iminoacetate synthase